MRLFFLDEDELMGRLIKGLLGLVFLLVLLLLAAVLIVPKVVDPNDYKPEIIAAVKEQTGRNLALNADLHLSVFPWLGIETGNVTLGNAQGFGKEPFAEIRQLGLRVKVLPLLSKQLEVDTLVLDGLGLNLAIDKSGRNNWDDLSGNGAGDGSSTAQSEQTAGGSNFALHIQGVEIRNAKVSWADQRTGESYVLNDLRLVSGAIASGAAVPLEAGFVLQSAQPERRMTFALEGELSLGAQGKRFSMPAMQAQVSLAGEGLPADGLAIALGAGLGLDMAKEQLQLSDIRLQGAGLDLSGELTVDQLKKTPQAKGQLKLAQSNLRQVLAGLGVSMNTADATALSAVSAELGLQQQGDTYRIVPLKLVLDQSHLTGQLQATPGKTLALSGQFDVDQINIDRYMAPDEADAKKAEAKQPAAAVNDDPLAALRTLNLDLSLKIKQLIAAKAKMQDVKVKLRNKAGKLQIDPLQAALYDGRLNASISVDARTKTPKIHAVKTLSGIDLGKLLADVAGEDRLLGKGDVKVDLRTQGLSEAEQRKALNGSGSFRLFDGAYKGVNIAELIRKTASALGLDDGRTDTGTANQTDFSELTATFTARNGLISNQDLQAKSPLLRLNGAGTIDLPADTIDYRLTTELVQSLEGQGGRAADKLAGVPIPVKIHGSLANPKYKPDLESAVASRAKKRVEREVKKALEGKLKGLFGR